MGKYTEAANLLRDLAESMEQMEDDGLDDSIASSDAPDGESGKTEDELIEELNQMFTPILVQQALENDIMDDITEAVGTLTERNIVKFDDGTRYAQLKAICAILLQRNKNTEKYKTWASSTGIAKAAKLDMQKEEDKAADALALKYLVNVSKTNSSSMARKAADNLLPETQH